MSCRNVFLNIRRTKFCMPAVRPNQEISEKSREIRKKVKKSKSESRRREISWKSVGNQLEITAKAGNQLEITEIRKSRTPVSYPSRSGQQAAFIQAIYVFMQAVNAFMHYVMQAASSLRPPAVVWGALY